MTEAAEWAGPVGDAWAAEWRRTDRSFAGLSRYLDPAIRAAITPGVRTIVDIGCGAGATSMASAQTATSARVVGIDLSPELIAVARGRGAAFANLSFVDGPVEHAVAAFAPVDLFVSRHGVMFFDDPATAFRALRAAAAPDARMVFSCFRSPALNPWASDVAAAILGEDRPRPAGSAPSPFAFADPAFVEAVLAASGWRPVDRQSVDFTYRAGEGADPVADALSFFQSIGPAAPVLRSAAPGAREAMLDRIAAVVERRRTGNSVDFSAAAWLWSARAADRERYA